MEAGAQITRCYKRAYENLLNRPFSAVADSGAIVEIYNHYIRHTVVTFEELELTTAQMLERINAVTFASLPWLVAEISGQVAGYAYASKFNSRSAYRFTVEATI